MLYETADGSDDHAYAARAILEFFQEEVVEEKVSEGEWTRRRWQKGRWQKGRWTRRRWQKVRWQKGNGIEKLVSLFEKLSVCERAPVLGGY